MIHEIYPDIFDNQYKNSEPSREDYALCFFDGGLYFDEDEGEIGFPRFKDISLSLMDKDLPAAGGGAFSGNFMAREILYAFSVNGDNYFLVFCTEAFPDYDAAKKDWRYFRTARPRTNAFIAMTAIHLYNWYESNRFCGRCGHAAIHSQNERMMQCPFCKNMMFPRISPAILAVIIDRGQTPGEDRILLTQYANRGLNFYVLVAGFVEIGETAEECVKREVLEEVGLKVTNVKYLASQPWGFAQNLMMGFSCELEGDDSFTVDESELKTAAWFTRESCPDRSDDQSSLTARLIGMFKDGQLSVSRSVNGDGSVSRDGSL